MTIYVDDQKNKFGGMILCHMLANTTDELHLMAQALGLRRCWFQGKRLFHYDITWGKRAEAIAHGAVAVSAREMAALIKSKVVGLPQPPKEKA